MSLHVTRKALDELIEIWWLARRARIEYPGAIYQLINRGHYQSNVFATQGAANLFLKTLGESVQRYGRELGADVVMRNHSPLALRDPSTNLAAGMHRLSAAFAPRFNRLRAERGHLFQGRYQVILLENEGGWTRGADYIHLNPVRGEIVPARWRMRASPRQTYLPGIAPFARGQHP